jgi:decaprenylphospho-beta-D-erythro-pentofuranosid-2-ulose 2-reductase
MTADPPGAGPAVAIFGATSAIAEQVARRYARDGARLFLAGRDGARLDAIANDLRIRGARSVTVGTADLDDPAGAGALLDAASDALGPIDVALVAFGVLGDQAASEADPERARAELSTNLVSPACLLLGLACRLERARAATARPAPELRGVIAVITSVAGDRGRRTNYVYGAAKAGLSTFLDGLRHRLHDRGIAVVDIRPGFVATPMTAHLPKGGPLWARPERVAADVQRAIARRRAVVYTPWFWRWIMLVIRLLPRPLFHRLQI